MEFTFNGVIPEDITFNGNYLERVKCNGVTVWEKQPTGTTSLKITANSTSTISMVHVNNSGEMFETPNVQYSLNGGLLWNELTFTADPNDSTTSYSRSFTFEQGESILFKGNNPNGFNNQEIDTNNAQLLYYNTTKFKIITGDVNVSGNVMSLIDNGVCNTLTIPNDYCFYGLFGGCTGITSISSGLLPATTLSGYCYEDMFRGCSSLVNVAADLLPANYINGWAYWGMFSNCTSLTTAPNLPALDVSYEGYKDMFSGCSSLNYVYCMITTTTTSPNPLNGWLSGVAASGTFYKFRGIAFSSGVSGIPSGWTVIEVDQ